MTGDEVLLAPGQLSGRGAMGLFLHPPDPGPGRRVGDLLGPGPADLAQGLARRQRAGEQRERELHTTSTGTDIRTATEEQWPQKARVRRGAWPFTDPVGDVEGSVASCVRPLLSHAHRTAAPGPGPSEGAEGTGGVVSQAHQLGDLRWGQPGEEVELGCFQALAQCHPGRVKIRAPGPYRDSHQVLQPGVGGAVPDEIVHDARGPRRGRAHLSGPPVPQVRAGMGNAAVEYLRADHVRRLAQRVEQAAPRGDPAVLRGGGLQQEAAPADLGDHRHRSPQRAGGADQRGAALIRGEAQAARQPRHRDR